MSKKKIREGDRIGYLTVLEDLGTTASNHHYYKCRCEKCGTINVIRREKLLKSKNPACRACSSGNDYTGKVINNFRFICETGKKTPSRNKIWKCECIKCGRTTEIASNRASEKNMPKCICEKYRGVSKSYIEQIF